MNNLEFSYVENDDDGDYPAYALESPDSRESLFVNFGMWLALQRAGRTWYDIRIDNHRDVAGVDVYNVDLIDVNGERVDTIGYVRVFEE